MQSSDVNVAGADTLMYSPLIVWSMMKGELHSFVPAANIVTFHKQTAIQLMCLLGFITGI